MTIEQLRKNLYNVGEATEMLQHVVWMRDNVKFDEALNGEYAGLGAKLDAAVTYFGNLVKELLEAAIAAVTTESNDGGEGKMTKADADVLTKALAEVGERFGKVKDSIDAALAKRAAPAVTAAPVVAAAIAEPASAVVPAVTVPAVAVIEPAPVGDLGKVADVLGNTLKAVTAIADQVTSLSGVVAALAKTAAPARTVGTGGDPATVLKTADSLGEIATKAEELAKRAEAAKDPGSMIRLLQKGLL